MRNFLVKKFYVACRVSNCWGRENDGNGVWAKKKLVRLFDKKLNLWYTGGKMEKVEIFENTKKFCKYWWSVYSPRGIEYCDYEQECAVIFFEKLIFAQGDEAIALAQKAYKWKLLDMMRKNDDTKISYTSCEIVGHEEKYFSLDDIGLNEVEKKFVKV